MSTRLSSVQKFYPLTSRLLKLSQLMKKMFLNMGFWTFSGGNNISKSLQNILLNHQISASYHTGIVCVLASIHAPLLWSLSFCQQDPHDQ